MTWVDIQCGFHLTAVGEHLHQIGMGCPGIRSEILLRISMLQRIGPQGRLLEGQQELAK